MLAVDDLLDLAGSLRRRQRPRLVRPDEEMPAPVASVRPRLALPVPEPETNPAIIPSPPPRLAESAPTLTPTTARPRLSLPSLDAPLETVAAPAMSQRPMLALPAVSREENAAMGRPPMLRGAPDRTEYDLNSMEGAGDYVRDVGQYKPQNHNSRLASVGLGLLRGFAQGGIGGALMGGAMHAFRPQMDEEYARRQALGEGRGALAEAYQHRKLDADLGEQEADTKYKLAQVYKNLHPEVKPNFQLKDGVDGVYAVNMNDPSAPPVKLPIELKGAADNYDVYDDGGKVWAINKRNPQDRYELSGVAPKPRPQLVTRTLSDGTTVQVPASSALSADSAITAANVSSSNRYGEASYEDQRREAERSHQEVLSQWQSAKSDVDKHAAARARMLDRAASIKAIEALPETERDDKTKLQYRELLGQNSADIAELTALEQNMINAYPGLVRKQPDGSFTVGARPALPKLPSRPAPKSVPRPRVAITPKSDPLGLFK